VLLNRARTVVTASEKLELLEQFKNCPRWARGKRRKLSFTITCTVTVLYFVLLPTSPCYFG